MHTPIPWIILGNGDIVHPTGKYLIPEAEWNDTVAYVWDRRDGHVEHDRRLIAAAPELLAALESILQEWDSPHWVVDYTDSADGLVQKIEAARAAIAKAKGETP